MASVSDICALYNSVFHALEIKRDRKSRVSPAQRKFIADVKAAGGEAEIGFGLDDCLHKLEAWGLLRGHVA